MSTGEHHIAQYVVVGPHGLTAALDAIKAATSALIGKRDDEVTVTVTEHGQPIECTVRLRREEDDPCA